MLRKAKAGQNPRPGIAPGARRLPLVTLPRENSDREPWLLSAADTTCRGDCPGRIRRGLSGLLLL